jgi:iron complex outermembrane receptor protein
LADDLTLRLNVASGFRAPNLAELTSNGVHEGTNRYEVETAI